MKKNKKGLLIGLIIILVLLTILIFFSYKAATSEAQGFILALAPWYYFAVMLMYTGIIASFYLFKGVVDQVKLPSTQRLNFLSFAKEHLLALFFIAFIILGLMGFWTD